MKKLALNLFGLLAFVALSVSMTSCGGDDDATKEGSLTFLEDTAYTPNAATVQGGKILKYGFTATDDEKRIEKIVVYRQKGTDVASKTTLETIPATDKKLFVGKFEYPVPTDLASGEYTLTFEAQDKPGAPIPGMTKTRTFTIGAALLGLHEYTAKLLGSQTNDSGSYYASATGTVYNTTDAQTNASKIDISFAEIGAPTTVPTLMSFVQRKVELTTITLPADAKKTYFKKVTPGKAFSAITEADIVAFGVATTDAQKISVALGDFIAFLTEGGKKGVLEVTALVAGTDATKTNGSITISTKVQK